MSSREIIEASQESYGKHPNDIYIGFDGDQPLRSSSLGSLYLAGRAFHAGDREMLVPTLVKVGRHNIDREFAIGKLGLGLAVMRSQYWAPHSKLTPFLKAWYDQVEEFTHGFQQGLDFSREASNQVHFYSGSLKSSHWVVSALYGASRRILEMEFSAIPRA